MVSTEVTMFTIDSGWENVVFVDRIGNIYREGLYFDKIGFHFWVLSLGHITSE